MNEINKNIQENQFGVEIENNHFDLDFSNILYSFMLFIQRTIPICKNTKLFKAIFKSLNTFPYEDKNFSNEIWIKLIESYYVNEEINLIKTNLFSTCLLLRFVLKALSEQRIQDIQKVKYFLINFIMKFLDSDEINTENKFDNFSEEQKEELKILFYYMYENTYQIGRLNDSMSKEFKFLSNSLVNVLFDSDEEIKRYLITYKIKLDEENSNRNDFKN